MWFKHTLFVLILLWSHQAFTQLVVNPVIQSKTHPSLKLDSIVIGPQTHCYLSVVNQNTEGGAWFCADSDIILVETESNIKHQLLRSEGIPVCPEAHQFTEFGEVLVFKLIFPVLVNKGQEIDIVENCADNCFSLKGIVLDPVLNKEIRLFEAAVDDFNNKRLKQALQSFELLNRSSYKNENHYAYTLYILPLISLKLGDEEKAKDYYMALKNSSILKKAYFLEKLHEVEFFQLINL